MIFSGFELFFFKGEKSYAAYVELGRKCQNHSSFIFNHPTFDERERKKLRDYVTNNREKFCKACGLNLKYKDYIFASYEYEAIVISDADCKICNSQKGRVCDISQHHKYHCKYCVS